MKTSRLTAVALALGAAISIGGCGTTPDPDQHNKADIAFAQQMIPHHRQAVAMAALAPQRAGSQPVKRLAADVEAAQQPEIDQMTGMLRGWNAVVPGDPGMAGMPGMDHDAMPGMSGMGHDSMPGMMSSQDMATLASAGGAAFDRQFLTMMISHHQGAVAMAATELRDGVNADARALARRISDSQTAQIDQMRGLLAAG